MTALLPNDADDMGTGRIEDGWHVLPMRVYWEDTDAAGIVYYANYLKFIERGRTDMLRHLGIAQRRLQQEDDVAFAVRSCNIEYLKPARLDDRLDVWTRVVAAGGLEPIVSCRSCGVPVLNRLLPA